MSCYTGQGAQLVLFDDLWGGTETGWKGGSGGTRCVSVYVSLIPVTVQQILAQYCKAVILQLKIN